MEIKKHICFQNRKAPLLYQYLQQNQIPFKEDDSLSVLDICQSDPHWPGVQRFVSHYGLLCQSETLYSEKERRNAQWLRMRSASRLGYPQPENDFDYEKDITYTRAEWCPICSSGLKQIGPFRMKRPPKWGKRCFAELNWVGDELFLNDAAREILTDAGISGISFRDVKNSSGKEASPDISQLVVHTQLQPGLIVNRPSIRSVSICPNCGVPKYLPSGIGMECYCRDIFENMPDIVKTGEIFGSDHYAARNILVRQNVYRAIREHKLDRGLVFDPIELI